MATRLLLADDSLTIRKVVELSLENQGFEILGVESAEEALARMAEFQPDIVIADTRMPGSGGLELCRKLKEQESYRRIPVILLSSTFENFDWEEARESGAVAYLTKPFEAKQLVEKLAAFLPPGHGEGVRSPGNSGPEETSPAAGESRPQWREIVREAVESQVQEIVAQHIHEVTEKRLAELDPEILKIVEGVVRELVPPLVEQRVREEIEKIKTGAA